MRLIVVDVEATCWRKDPPGASEIIEIGAVAYEQGSGEIGAFQTFVQPHNQPVLSKFCRGLTRIKQADVDTAPKFSEALRLFSEWSKRCEPFRLASWGDYDYRQFIADCALHAVDYPFETHLNLKRLFARVERCKPCGMRRALRMVGLTLKGAHHRGLDDARNIVQLLEHLIVAKPGLALESLDPLRCDLAHR